MSGLISHLSLEEQLLLSLARVSFSDAQKEQIRKLAEKITDWDYFIRLANEHGLIALCRHNLNIAGASRQVPEKMMEIMHSSYLRSLTQNTRLYNLLEEIVTLASRNDISIILLKGAVLEKMVYGNSGLRQMSDIDLLVRTDDALPLRNLLLENGFESLPLISPLHEKLLPYLKSHLPVMHKNGISAEIHVRLFDRENDNLICEIFNNKVLVDETIPAMYAPPLQLHFLYLIKHLDRHAKTRDLQLKLYTDIATLLSDYPDHLLHPEMLTLAERAGLSKPLTEILFLINKFWGISMPDHIENLISGVDAENLTGTFTGFLRNPASYPRHNESTELLRPLRDIPGITGKIRYVIGYLFPSLSFLKYKFILNHRLASLFYYPAWWRRCSKIAKGKGHTCPPKPKRRRGAQGGKETKRLRD